MMKTGGKETRTKNNKSRATANMQKKNKNKKKNKKTNMQEFVFPASPSSPDIRFQTEHAHPQTSWTALGDQRPQGRIDKARYLALRSGNG